MFDVNALLDGLTMSAEDKGVIQDLFKRNPDAVTSIGSQISTHIDTALSGARADLDTKSKELEAEWNALRAYRGNDEEAIAAAEKRIEALTSQVAVATSRLESVGRRAGIDVEPLLKDIREATPAAKPPAPAGVESTMNADQILGQAGKLAWNAVELNAALFDIDREHQRLFGKPLPSASDFIRDMTEEARRTNNRALTPQQFAEKKFGFDAKRTELQEAAVQTRIATAVTEAVQKERSEAALRVAPGVPGAAEIPQSPIFSTLKPEAQSPVRINGVPETVSAAILAFRKLQQPAA